MTERVVAVDIDLRQFAAWDSESGMLGAELSYTDFARTVWRNLLMANTVLLECASPMLYRGKIHRSTMSWMIYNSAAVTNLVFQLGQAGVPNVRVAPSSTWTKGLSEPIRHKLAGVIEPIFPRKKGRHDLKECQAMIWTYRNEPELWLPLEQYLETL
jgi:hypothetical protein